MQVGAAFLCVRIALARAPSQPRVQHTPDKLNHTHLNRTLKHTTGTGCGRTPARHRDVLPQRLATPNNHVNGTIIRPPQYNIDPYCYVGVAEVGKGGSATFPFLKIAGMLLRPSRKALLR